MSRLLCVFLLGFLRGFKATNIDNGCRLGTRDVLTAPTGQFKFPDTRLYRHGISCYWIVSNGSPNQPLTLNFTSFQLEWGGSNCVYDYLEVWQISHPTSRLGRFCHTSSPGAITLPSGTALLHFRSDYSVAHQGFRFNWYTGSSCPAPKDIITNVISGLGQDANLRYVENTTVSNTCPTGWVLASGDINRTCDSNGTWSGVPPLCQVEGCDEWYNSTSGNLSFPISGGNYPNNANCSWVLDVSPNQGVVATFLQFDMKLVKPCSSDYLEIRDGPSADSHLIGRFCDGRALPNQGVVIATSSQMYFHFSSDKSGSDPGFSYSWTSERGCRMLPVPPRAAMSGDQYSAATAATAHHACLAGHHQVAGSTIRTCLADGSWSGTPLVCQPDECGGFLNSTSGSLTFPANMSSNSTYPPYANCTWVVQAQPNQVVYVTVEEVALERSLLCSPSSYLSEGPVEDAPDLLELRDGNDTDSPRLAALCGSVSAIDYNTTQRYLHINFKSDSSIEGHGFRLSWSSASTCPELPSVNNTEVSGSLVVQNANRTYSCLRSTHSIVNGSRVRTCQADGTWSGSPPVCAVPGCGGRFNSTNGTIQFPVVGERYLHYLDCTWIIDTNSNESVTLNFTSFHVEYNPNCGYDYLLIRDGASASAPSLGKYCGTSLPNGGTISSRRGQVYLHFHSDYSVAHPGFSISWALEPPVVGCGGSYNSSSGSLAFPVGRVVYPRDTTCVWTLDIPNAVKISLRFSLFQLEPKDGHCCGDYVEVLEGLSSSSRQIGKYCGSNLPGEAGVVQGNRGQMYIQFYSDLSTNYGNYTGFNLSWTSEVQCPPLPSPPNTIISGDSNQENDVKRYRCQEGFVLVSGTANRTCLPDATWTGAPPVCDRVKCPDPGSPENSHRIGTFTFGETLTYTCTLGYFRSAGNWHLVCLANGTWDGVPPNCSRITCGAPYEVRNARRSGNVWYGDHMTYTCLPGFAMTTGSAVLTCGEGGKWLGRPPVCSRRTCGEPEAAANSKAVGGHYFGDKVTYWCHEDFQLSSGDRERECRADSTWSGRTPRCEAEVQCPPLPNPQNTIIIGDSDRENATKLYRCQKGFVLVSGTANRTCRHDATWTGAPPVCNRITCGRPHDVKNARWSGNVAYGDHVTYKCLPGFTMTTGHGILTCGEGGMWREQQPVCSRRTCGEPEPAANAKAVGGHYLGDKVYYQCHEGFRFSSGDRERECRADGTWSGQTPRCVAEVQCPPLSDPQNSITIGDSNRENATKWYRCREGYILVSGTTNRTCLPDATWTGAPPVCDRLNCVDPGVPENSKRSGTLIFGGTLTYTCARGYFWSAGGSSLLCLANGTWAGMPPNCSRITCGAPYEVMNGHWSGNVSYGDHVTYTCLPGFTMTTGSNVLTCGEYGLWRGQPPLCSRRACSEPEPVANATVVGGRYFGDTVTYWCHEGFKLSTGDQQRECRAEGTWSGQTPRCDSAITSEGVPLWRDGKVWMLVVLSLALLVMVVMVVGRWLRRNFRISHKFPFITRWRVNCSRKNEEILLQNDANNDYCFSANGGPSFS